MKKLTSSIAAALTLAACGAAEDPAAQYRDALPMSSAVQVGAPSATQTAPTGVAVTSDASIVPGYQSEYAFISYWTAVTFNGGVWWTLEFLRHITMFRPTSCDDTSCTWGPWKAEDGLVVWKLHVAKVDGHYEYALSARPAADDQAPFVVIISGTAFPGADRNHGSGTFVIDFDALDALPHPVGWVKRDQGLLTVNYDNTSAVHIDARFLNALNQDPDRPHAMNAAYVFDRTSGAGGELQIAFEDLVTTETLSLRTRWIAGGAGRGDLHFVGAGGTPNYLASECWDGAAAYWAKTYDTDPPYGTEAACVFSPASYADVPLP